ncbi:MAG: dihydrofolate reductase family protein [Pyrinomonadaceae bacterium]|nr:dihydrofolate reductase family protein [Pyrinomonadaceae bacterium]
MIKTSVFCGVSLDGFIARENGDIDWLTSGESAKEDYGYNDFIAAVDALVIGRNTYETVLGFGGWFYGEMPVYVLSSRELEKLPEGGKVERMSGEPKAILEELASRGHTHVYVDGGVTVQRFLRDDAIDRIIVSRLPILIGTGIPLFGETGRDIRLKLVSVKEFPSGMVQTEYAVKR